MTAPKRLLDGLEACPDRVAFEIDGRALRYADLASRARGWAAKLAALGAQPGDRVAFFGPSSATLLVALTAHLRAGLVHVPINTRYKGAEIRHILEDSGARVLVAAPDSEAADVARSMTPAVVVVDPADPCFDDPGGPALLAPPPTPDALAMLVYTSGTTGRSKGVMLSHGALEANVGAVTHLWRWRSTDRLCLTLPLFHVHGLGLGVLGTLLNQASALILPRFSAPDVVAAFRDHGCTLFMGVPTMHSRLLAHLDAHPGDADVLRRGRLFTSGSAALPAGDLGHFAVHTGHRILERYGMTETGFTLSNPYPADARRAGTVGFPVPGYAVRLVDDAGRPIADGRGEIQVRGDGLMMGYWRQPEATRAAFTDDGWFRTGDVAERDADGYYAIVGRRSVDIIKSGGFKLSAREIEDVLARHPRVAEVAVIGVPDAEWGEAVAAAVVLAPGHPPITEAALCDLLAAHTADVLADFKKPRLVRVIAELPRNALGKVQKHRLRAEFG